MAYNWFISTLVIGALVNVYNFSMHLKYAEENLVNVYFPTTSVAFLVSIVWEILLMIFDHYSDESWEQMKKRHRAENVARRAERARRRAERATRDT